MSVVALSGWGQPFDALREIAPQAAHVDYARASSVEKALDTLAGYAPRCVIGWSLGGQMAVRAIIKGIWKPERLVLIAAPFRLKKNLTMAKFRENFLKNPERALSKGYALIAHEDTRGEHVRQYLEEARKRLPAHDWLYWLEALSMHNFEVEDLKRFPQTTLLHGDRDAVIGLDQSKAFQQALPGAALHVFKGCGHAPHWHDAERVRGLLC
jgi:pimeloyl-ACP methyl ester carboxylesterase